MLHDNNGDLLSGAVVLHGMLLVVVYWFVECSINVCNVRVCALYQCNALYL